MRGSAYGHSRVCQSSCAEMKYIVKSKDGKFQVLRVDDFGVESGLTVHVLESEALGEVAWLMESDAEAFEATFSEAGDVGVVPAGNDGSRWDVTILKFGKSSTPPHYFYSQERMAENIDQFNGAKLYLHSRSDRGGHVSDPNKKSSKDIVGFISNSRIAEGVGVVGTANVLPSAKWLKANLVELSKQKRMDVLQLSIDAYGMAQPRMVDGERLPEVVKIKQVDVDIVPRAAAGGAFVKLAESLPFPNEFARLINSQTEGLRNMNLLQKIASLFTMLYPAVLMEAELDWSKINENDLWTKLLEADKPQDRLHLPDGTKLTEKLVDEKMAFYLAEMKEAGSGKPKPQPKGVQIPETMTADVRSLQEQVQKLEQGSYRQLLESTVAATKLPIPIQEHIKKSFVSADGSVKKFQESELLDFIRNTREVFGKVLPAEQANQYHVTEGMDERDKALIGLERFFMSASRKVQTPEEIKAYKDIPAFRSFREGYVQLTGDTNVTGMAKNAVRLSESIVTGDFPKMLGELINKVMVREYSLLELDTWKTWASIVGVNDFRTQHRVRWGGYSNLPAVAQRAPYTALTSPTDEEATYLATKRGGTEDMTRESILNDDVSWLSRIPIRMARAAAQTIHEFCYDSIKPASNPTIYDGVVLYHATNPTVLPHANTATAALASDGVALAAARLRMRRQRMKDNLKPIGLRARYLVVPPDLEQIAYGLVTPAFNLANQVPTFLQKLGVMPIVVDYWTDVTDWALIADPSDINGFEIGFIGGQQDPMTFVSDLPNAGSLFTNDVITFKIRHEYGGAVLDYRAFDGSIVAG